MNNQWKDRYWDLFHIFKAQEVFLDQIMLMITYDKDIGIKRKYDGFIQSKQEEMQKRRNQVDALVLNLPQGE